MTLNVKINGKIQTLDFELDTAVKTAGGKPIYTGSIVRPAKRSNFTATDAGKRWRVKLRDNPFVLVDADASDVYDYFTPWYERQLVIVEEGRS